MRYVTVSKMHKKKKNQIVRKTSINRKSANRFQLDDENYTAKSS